MTRTKGGCSEVNTTDHLLDIYYIDSFPWTDRVEKMLVSIVLLQCSLQFLFCVFFFFNGRKPCLESIYISFRNRF